MAKRVLKRCTRCKERKPRSEFYAAKTPNYPNRLTSRCKPCTSLTNKERYHQTPVEVRQAKAQRWVQNSVERRRAYRLEKDYGLTVEQFDQMVEDQNNKCAACHEEFTSTPHVDHDHACCPRGSCGKCIRGLLCRQCNTMLGKADDSIEVLQQLIVYLKKWK